MSTVHDWVSIRGNAPSKSNLYKIITLKNGKGGYYSSLGKTNKLTSYEKSFYLQVPAQMRNKLIDGFFEFELNVYYPANRADLDNSLKVVLDCLQFAKVIKNDNKCVKIIAQKFVDKVKPRVEFRITEV